MNNRQLKYNEATFRDRCDNINGMIQWSEDGLLLSCVEPRNEYNADYLTYFEQKNTEPREYDLNYVIENDTEKNRLIRYFLIIYPNTEARDWYEQRIEKLVQLYKSLEIYYDIPGEYDPRTPKTQRRNPDIPLFFRVPENVELQQREYESGFPPYSWVEVVHFGPLNTDFYVPESNLFTGTYYYPAEGSGVYLYLGNSLIAWNKVHALHLLGVPNDKILDISGNSFSRWLNSDIKNILSINPTFTYEYAKSLALDNMINQMISGVSTRTSSIGQHYFGLGGSTDTGDTFLAQQAAFKGYDTIQLIKEAQLTSPNTANIGFEIIDLRTPEQSQKNLFIGLRDYL